MTRKVMTPGGIQRLLPMMLAVAIVLGACAPGMTVEQFQTLVQESVAKTVEAQNSAATAQAQSAGVAPSTSTPTSLATLPSVSFPTLTPLATVTPFSYPMGGGGGGGTVSKPKWSCDVWTRPYDNTAFKPGDPFDIKWVITNTGTATWESGKDLEYYSGPKMADKLGVELPRMKPGDSYTFTSDANAPLKKGFFVMTYKLEGGFCWPYVAIISGKPGDP